MQVEISGYLVAKQYDWEDAPTFSFLGFDPEGQGLDYVTLNPYSFVAEVPDNFDIRPHKIEMLRKDKEKLQAEFAKRVKELDDQINRLLAIENNGDAK